MSKSIIITAFLFLIFIRSSLNLKLHEFYALQNTDVVSQSESIVAMNKCKDECLKMGMYFPFRFKVNGELDLVSQIYSKTGNR